MANYCSAGCSDCVSYSSYCSGANIAFSMCSLCNNDCNSASDCQALWPGSSCVNYQSTSGCYIYPGVCSYSSYLNAECSTSSGSGSSGGDTSGGSVNGGGIAGIVIALLVVFGALAAFAYYRGYFNQYLSYVRAKTSDGSRDVEIGRPSSNPPKMVPVVVTQGPPMITPTYPSYPAGTVVIVQNTDQHFNSPAPTAAIIYTQPVN